MNQKKKHLLSDAEIEKIKQAVAQAEKYTTGEIVPALVPASDHYAWVHGAWAVIGWVIVSASVWGISFASPWAHSVKEILIWQMLGILFGYLIAYVPTFKRFLVSEKIRKHYVSRQSLACFMEAGLHETHDRTGVLIYLSVFEKQVKILADKGINEKVPAGFWQSQVDSIVSGIHSRNEADVLCKVIEGIGKKLSEYYPAKEGTHNNEISNNPLVTDPNR
jgi:putative membrane protein